MHFWRFSAATDVGLQRNNNEDTYLSSPEVGLWAVADGMGGHAAGEVASAIAAETLQHQISQGATLADAIQSAHKEILAAAASGKGGAGMGSTIVALHSIGNHYEVAWVGDSRAYLWSPRADDPLKQITTDHSYVQLLYQTGAITALELETHPEKNIITQCLGSIELDRVTVDITEGEWKKGEWIVLCSDGLSDAVTSDDIATILSTSPNVQQATKALIDSALSHGGRDNITVAIIEFPAAYANIFHSLKRMAANLFT